MLYYFQLVLQIFHSVSLLKNYTIASFNNSSLTDTHINGQMFISDTCLFLVQLELFSSEQHNGTC